MTYKTKAVSHGLVNLFLTIAAAASLSGCAGTQVQYQESLLSAAGFKETTPSTPKQQAFYNGMTAYKLEHGTYKGESIYAYADKKKGVVYIGGKAAYQRAVAQQKLEVTETQMYDSAEEAFGVNVEP
jgi:hypothetical protein